MLRAVIRKEMLNNLVSFRFLVTTFAMVALAALATLIARTDYEQRLRDYHRQLAEHRQELQSVQVYSWLQPVALRPPEPLSVLDQGYDARLGNEVKIHVFAVPVRATGGERGNEFMGPFQGVDLTLIVQVVLGLLALLLSFDAVIGEWEKGTLALTLANPVSRTTLLAGKYLGGLLTLLTALLLSFGTGVVLLAHGDAQLDASTWWRLGGLLASYVAYGSIMLLLGLVISLFARTAASALVISLFAWLAVVFVLPQASVAVTTDLLGAETGECAAAVRATALVAERDRLLAETWRADPFLARASGHYAPVVRASWNRAVRRRYGSALYYDALARYYSWEVATGMGYAEKIFAVHQQQTARSESTTRWAVILAAPSPAFLLDRLSQSFAGTSPGDHDRFLAACRRYRERLIDELRTRRAFSSWRWFTDDPADDLRPWPTLFGLTPEEVDGNNVETLFARLGEPEVAARIAREQEELDSDPARLLDLEGMPRFRHRSPRFAAALRAVAPAAVAMLGLHLVLAAMAWARFRRYQGIP